MNCPKCGKEMLFGEIAYDQFSQGKPLLFWAPKEFYSKHIANFLSRKKAIQEGGMEIPVENGVLHNRTQGYACKDCNFVLIDCGKK